MQDPNDMTAAEAAGHLLWLAEMGAGEIITETPVDRLSDNIPSLSPQSASPRKPGPMVLAEPPPVIAPGREMGPGFRRDDGTGRADAATLAAACHTLDEIAAALEVFDACPLKKTATRLCFADGNRQSRVMLVGEAPGREEDIEGKPFVGRSGQLLDRMLAAIGLSRHSADRESSVFITNTIFWRPPGNRTPTAAETAMSIPFLLRTIELQNPDFVVCLGATPSQRLSGRSDGILSLRGKWYNCSVNGRTYRLLATLHPAYLLRQPNQKRLAWRDFLSLRQALDGRSPA